MRWIDDVGAEVHRLWSVRVAIFLFVFNGALLGLAAFVDVLNPWLFLGLNMIGYGALGVVRLVKQAPKVDVEPGA
jgi:hypothetical protein